MYSKTLVLALWLGIYLVPVRAYFVMPCPGRLVRERLDPIVSPGKVSSHVHTISGGSAFAADYTYEDARGSKCSSCTIKQDMSNYWTPQLYVNNKDGTFTAVPSRGDGDDSTGGMKVYYFYGKDDNTQPFPEGFRMLAGDPFKRNFTGDIAAKALTYYCDGSNLPNDTYGLPNANCAGYLKIQFHMPACWNNKDKAPPEGKGHMSYFKGDNPRAGDCPDDFPVRLPILFYEVEYDTGRFADQWQGDQHPFVFAQGDHTGYGFHGDFTNGWETTALTNAIKQCTSDPNGNIGSCSVLSEYSWDECRACKVPATVNEDVNGPMPKLPGCNSITDGPEPAQPVENCDDDAQLGAAAANFVDLTMSKKWEYVGCGTDVYNSRTFTGANTASDDMTVEKCVDFCSGKSFSYAGLEYGRECYCDNNLNQERAPKDGVYGSCNKPCAGNAKEYCGAASALSIYHKCGDTCQNQQIGGSNSNSTSSALATVVDSPPPASSSSKTHNAPTAPTTLSTNTKVSPPDTHNARPTNAPQCPHFNCINQAFMSAELAKPFCATYTQGTTTDAKAIPTFLNNCGGKAEEVSSACSCLAVPTAYVNG